MAASLIACLGLVACGDSGGGSGATSGGTGTPAAATAKAGTTADFKPMEDFCGDKPMNVALADGFGGNTWRKITLAEFKDEAAKCDNIESVTYTDGKADQQKAISDINGLVARGTNVIVAFPDLGASELPAISKAYKAGTSIVPYHATVGGAPGQDYTAYVGLDNKQMGRDWAAWMADQLKGKGNVVFLGGVPGNTLSLEEFQGVKEEMAKHPGIKLLVDKPVDTGWDQGQSQKVMAGLLAKYPKIDGVISDYGASVVGALRAVQEAGRDIPKWAAQDWNEFSCMGKELMAKDPDFAMMTLSAHHWLARLALRQAVAGAQGIKSPEPTIVRNTVLEDPANGKPLKCDKSLPPDASLASTLPPEKLQEALK